MNVIGIIRGLAHIGLNTAAGIIEVGASLIEPPEVRAERDIQRFLGNLHQDHHNEGDTCSYPDCRWCWRRTDLAPSEFVTYQEEELGYETEEIEVDEDQDDGLTWGPSRDDMPDIWADIHKEPWNPDGWRT